MPRLPAQSARMERCTRVSLDGCLLKRLGCAVLLNSRSRLTNTSLPDPNRFSCRRVYLLPPSSCGFVGLGYVG